MRGILVMGIFPTHICPKFRWTRRCHTVASQSDQSNVSRVVTVLRILLLLQLNRARRNELFVDPSNIVLIIYLTILRYLQTRKVRFMEMSTKVVVEEAFFHHMGARTAPEMGPRYSSFSSALFLERA